MSFGKKLAYNTALLTGSTLVMRWIGLAWQVWLAGRIGPAGIGLFQLVMSVGFLFVTLAVSGIRFAVTRLLSEELGQGRDGSVEGAMRRAAGYSALFGTAALIVLWAFAQPIGFLWVRDARTVLSLRLLALSLPAAGLSSVLAGYFTAVGRVWKTAAEQFLEQLLRMALVALLLYAAPQEDLERSCAAVVAAGTIADWLGALALYLLYRSDRRIHTGTSRRGQSLTPRMLAIAFPLALSAYARSALNTFRQLLVPRGLRQSGLSADAALTGYGIINGMAMPILLFPTCLPSALAELLVPALTQAQVTGQTDHIRRQVRSLLTQTAIFSLAAAVFFWCTADALGYLVYGTPEAGRYIRLLSPLVPFLYLDIVTDGCLKGLGQMMRSMTYNIAEAALGLVLVWALLPVHALAGYVFVLYVCEIFNFSLSIGRLWKVALAPCPDRKGKAAGSPRSGLRPGAGPSV